MGSVVLYVTSLLPLERWESDRPCGVPQLHVIDTAGIEQFTGINENYIQVSAALDVDAELP